MIETGLGEVNGLSAGAWIIALAIFSILICSGTGCRRKEERVIVRILIPSGPSVIEEAIVKLEVSPLKTGDGRIIVPATIATKDEHDYRDFLQKVQTFHPEEAVIVATAEDIPVPLRAETRYATRPCSNFPRPCIAIVGPWASAEERQALDVVLRRLAPDTGPK